MLLRNFTLNIKHLNINYINRAACAIPDGDSVVIVGGQFTLKDVSRYNEGGFVEALPSLAIGGGFQSCVGYINGQNKMVIHYQQYARS